MCGICMEYEIWIGYRKRMGIGVWGLGIWDDT